MTQDHRRPSDPTDRPPWRSIAACAAAVGAATLVAAVGAATAVGLFGLAVVIGFPAWGLIDTWWRAHSERRHEFDDVRRHLAVGRLLALGAPEDDPLVARGGRLKHSFVHPEDLAVVVDEHLNVGVRSTSVVVQDLDHFGQREGVVGGHGAGPYREVQP